MTTDLTPAKLIRLKQVAGRGKNGKPSYEPEDKGSVDVQFNPTTLKISRTNNIDKGGATTRTQKRQTPSVQPAILSFDLEFDTAEGDRQGRPLDVRDLTHVVRQFAEPTKEKPNTPPPAVRFAWGSFMFQGIVTQLTEDLDYFSPTGMPLRAKVSVSITEQNPEWEAAAIGPGARDARAASHPGATPRPSGGGSATTPAPVAGNGPGSGPTPNPVTTALARAGESVQQLLARLDADPATWRTAMAGLGSPLSLAAGAQVQLGASVSASAGLGASGGFTAGAGLGAIASVRGALGGGINLRGGLAAEATAGFVLANSGGVAKAAAAVAAAEVASARGDARASFAVPTLAATAGVSTSASARVSVTPDPRSLGFGRGIPLRARVTPS
ncbi:hypothetical protein EV649_5072 [Kribbella sp. VKM Ac-2569]|uniref:CIS tube protein n=1 Tax=Kribbella sp. VKM Ac-2569 TaxID=2512220 RepID=UPI00102B8DD5|nr:hypothetical protein [Kribbella sp. VKM Ac-2569]RZT17525.1 hypothetical protein EV649_5072 [Kribbella sp. VKM Ac-2569]